MQAVLQKRWFCATCLAIAVLVPVLCGVFEMAVGVEPDDSSVFRYMGWRMTVGGGRCYIDAWDHKGPVVYLFNALGFLICPCGTKGTTLVFSLLWVGSILLAYRFLKVQGKSGAAAVCSLFLSLFAIGNGTGRFLDSQEALGVFFACLGINVLFSRERKLNHFLFGVAVGCSFMAKASMVAFGGAAVALWLFDLHSTRDVKSFLGRCGFAFLGFSAALALLTLAFLPNGVKPMWDASFLYNLFEYHQSDLSWVEWWTRFFQDRPNGTSGWWQLPLFGLLVGSAAVSLIRNREGVDRRLRFYMTVFLIFECIIAFMMKTFYFHYLVLAYVPLAIVLALNVGKGSNFVFWSSVVALCFFSVGIMLGLCYSRMRILSTDKTITWIKENLDSSEPIAVFGATSVAEVLCQCGMKTPQRHFCTRLYLDDAKPARRALMIEELEQALNDCKHFLADFSIDDIKMSDVPEDLKGVFHLLYSYDLIWESPPYRIYRNSKRR